MMSDRLVIGNISAWLGVKRPRLQDETKLGNAAVTSRDGAEGSLACLSGHRSLQDASRFSGLSPGHLGGGS